MPTFSQRKTPTIAQRMTELVGAPQIADMQPQRRFEMPREKGPAYSSEIVTRAQELVGAQPDAMAVSSPDEYPNAHIETPDLFAASVAAVKALTDRRKLIDRTTDRARTKGGPGRFESDVRRALHLQEREDGR